MTKTLESVVREKVGVSLVERMPFFNETNINGVAAECKPYLGFTASWWSPVLNEWVRMRSGELSTRSRVLSPDEAMRRLLNAGGWANAT